MPILEDFKKYRDYSGLQGLETDGVRGEPTQNGQLFAIEYLFCLIANKVDITEEVNRLKQVFQSLELHKGTSIRKLHSDEGNSMDNNIALLTFSSLFDKSRYAIDAREHGLNVQFQGVDWEQGPAGNGIQFAIAWLINGFKPPKNFWNNTKPGWFAGWGWYGRSPGYMGFLDYCATGNTTLFRGLSLWVGQFLGCFADTGNTDARKLPYIVWQRMEKQNLFWRLSYKLWCFILMRQYPEGMKTVYSKYFKSDHPMNKYSIDYLA